MSMMREFLTILLKSKIYPDMEREHILENKIIQKQL
jgi:hypothetical protein